MRIALMMVLCMSAGLATGCSEKPREPAQYCEQVSGPDKFIIDPNDRATVTSIGVFGPSRILFTDKLSGWQRVMSENEAPNYRCRAARPEDYAGSVK